jgi:hypothetical protein
MAASRSPEGRVELGPARQQFVQPRLVLEVSLGLGLMSVRVFPSRWSWSRSSAAAVSRARSVCSMLCMVPIGLSVLMCAA